MFVQAGGVLVKGQEVWMNVWVDLHNDSSTEEVVMAKLHKAVSIGGFNQQKKKPIIWKILYISTLWFV